MYTEGQKFIYSLIFFFKLISLEATYTVTVQYAVKGNVIEAEKPPRCFLSCWLCI